MTVRKAWDILCDAFPAAVAAALARKKIVGSFTNERTAHEVAAYLCRIVGMILPKPAGQPGLLVCRVWVGEGAVLLDALYQGLETSVPVRGLHPDKRKKGWELVLRVARDA
jgi:hypothetical protein